MREIKFRGLRTDGKGWAYGYLMNHQTISKVGEIPYYYPYSPVIPKTVGQFTGAKDKHGVEIYEGDLLSDKYEDEDEGVEYEDLRPVVWCETTLQWCVDASFAKDGSYLTSMVDYFGEFLEVKGNVYEKGGKI